MLKIGKNKIRFSVILFAIIALILTIVLIVIKINTKVQLSNYDNELLRTMSYEQFVDGDEAVENTDNVKFSSFFLRDLDGDGYAEKIKGTCKEVGAEDTLYMEIIVQTAGYLKDAKIDINGQNFYLETALPKDNELKNNYIGNDIRTIEFEQLNNGTQKLLTGVIRNNVGNNINNYSRTDNNVVLTGTYVADNGTEIPITKQIDLATDWYGTTEASIYSTNQSNSDLPSRIDEASGKISLSFDVKTEERKKELNISSNYVEGTIPQLNGCDPISVSLKSGTGEFTYDENTRKFTITKNAVTDDNGRITTSISKYLYNKIDVIYPIEAYTYIENDILSIKIPVSTYYEGYNNPNSEFQNPYKSNIAEATIVVNYSSPVGQRAYINVTVGEYVTFPNARYIVKKEKPLKIYKGISSEEKMDRYKVRWYISSGTDGETSGAIISENSKVDEFIKNDSRTVSMEEVTTNVGIGFSGVSDFLKNDGYLKVYNIENDELILELNSSNYNQYTDSDPFYYAESIKHIRVETSSTNANSSMYIYNIKELDDEYITENFTREEFDKLSYIKSYLNVKLGNDINLSTSNQAKYEESLSVANIYLSKKVLSTQVTEKNDIITISATENQSNNVTGWVNGMFLVKLPEEMIDVELNNVEINNNNVRIISYEVIEKNNSKFIKVNTANNSAQSYDITLNVDLTPDPRISSVNKNVELYAINELTDNYYYTHADNYDVDNDGKTAELINYGSVSVDLVAPNSLLTNQTISNFDDEETIIVSPKVADLKPIYSEDEVKKQTARIGIQIKNNYSNTISEILVLGKIPFEGNTYVISDRDLNSDFSTTMKSTGILVPNALKNKVTVYYSDQEKPTKDVNKAENNWKLQGEIADWNNIKTFLIDFNDTILGRGEEHIFYYDIEISSSVEFNKIAYSHHGIYFSLDTLEGKYRTRTEPNRVGIMIAEKYVLELDKYQTGKDKRVSGATYKISEVDNEGNIMKSKTSITNETGTLLMDNLYAERYYEIEEIKTPEDYELNNNPVKIITHVNRQTGEMSVEKITGTTRSDVQIVKNEGQNYRAIVQVEDEANLKLKIIKTNKETNELLKGAKFKLTGPNLSENGRIITTNVNGEAFLSGLKVGGEYSLEETKAKGYYLDNNIRFKVVNDNGTYNIEILENEIIIKNKRIEENDSLPTLVLELQDEKIPTYNLEVIKQKTQELQTSEDDKYLAGAIFKLYKDDKVIGTYETGDDGKLLIEGLYQYEDSRNIDQTYVLKEFIAPEGFVEAEDLVFSAKAVEKEETVINNGVEETVMVHTLQLNQNTGKDNERLYVVNGNTISVIVEDQPVFKLVKKDGETGEVLQNAKFQINNITNGKEPARNTKNEILGTKEIIDGNEYYTINTDENGVIVADLPEGLYEAVEIDATDEKYDLSNNVQRFGIGKSRYGEPSIEWSKASGSNKMDDVEYATTTSDGSFIVVGFFEGRNIQLTDSITLTNNANIAEDGFIIKYNSDGEIEWADTAGGGGDDRLISVTEDVDGGYIVGGYFWSPTVTLTGGKRISGGNGDGYLIKYSKEGQIEWTKRIGSCLYPRRIKPTSDGGYLVGGWFWGPQTLENNVRLSIYGSGAHADNDGYIIKYDTNFKAQWAHNIGGIAKTEAVVGVVEASDGYYAVGQFCSNQITINGQTVLTNHKTGNNSSDGYIIKFGYDGTYKWSDCIGGTSSDWIEHATGTADGDCIIAGMAVGSLTLGDGTKINNAGGTDAIIIRYDSNGNVKLAKNIGGSGTDCFYDVAPTSDGGFIATGKFNSSNLKVNDNIVLKTSGNYDVFTVKFTPLGEAEWGGKIGGSGDEKGEFVGEDINGGYFLTNQYKSNPLKIDANTSYSNKGDYDLLTVKLMEINAVSEKTELIVNNYRKEYKITTDINEIDGVKGGTISGEDEKKYEVVKYGDDSQKEILIDPNDNYEIISITINGEEYVNYVANDDGTYVMPQFENVLEDKHVVVTFASKTNKITINKIDKTTREGIQNVEFKLDQIEEREEPVDVIGELHDNSQTYYYTEDKERDRENENLGGMTNNGQDYTDINLVEEVDNVLGDVNNNGTYYFVTNDDGSLIPTNGKTYVTEHGGTSGVANSTAYSYLKVDLTGYTGKYSVVVNAEVSSEGNYDYGYATITENTNAVSYSTNGNYFMCISGTIEAKDYRSNALDGGSIYYLHLGYRKDSSTDTNKDQVRINNIKVYSITTNTTNYNFINNNGVYESNNIGKDSTVANSYIPIDLREKEGKYELIVNAKISSQSGSDYGYATITNNTDRPQYNSSNGRFIYISGNQSAKDYSYIMDAGSLYYLHFGYYKNANSSSGDDKFTINSVNLYKQTPYLFNFTNNNGKYESTNNGRDNTVSNSYVPIDLRNNTGKYSIIINAKVSSENNHDYGYATITKDTNRPAYNSGTGRFIYLSGNQSAKDYKYVLNGGFLYYLHLGYYKDGRTSSGDDKFTINNIKIELNDSELYHTLVTTNSEGQAITQIPFGKYSVTEINTPIGYKTIDQPIEIEFRGTDGAQHEFTIENEKKAKLIVHHYIKGTETKLADDEEYYGDIDEDYTTSPKLDIEKYSLEKDDNDEFILPTNATGKYTLEDTEVTYFYVSMPAMVRVNHYIEGTETPVPLNDGSDAPKVIKNGEIGANYTTEAITTENLDQRYELIEVPNNSTGTFTEEEITVNYFYKLKSYKITTEVEEYDQTNILGDTEHIRGGNILGEKENPYEIVKHSENSKKDIIVTPEQGFEVQSLTINGDALPFTAEPDGKVLLNKFTNVTEDKHVVVRLGKKKSSVLVHHYIEGTTTKVPSKYGGEVQDQTTSGPVGNPYITNPTDELTDRY